jgi:DUF4097 and DUF4098 domain-containing protein YvlB
MRPRGSIVGPLILITIGVLFLMHTIWPEFSVGDIISRYWPYLLIAWGTLQLIEVSIRFARNTPVPANGVSGGGWFLVAIICLVGLGYYEVHNRTDTWWRRAGIEQGVEMFGDAHDYEVAPIQKSAGKTPKVIIENFRGDAKITGADVSEVSVTGHKTIRALDEGEANRANLATPVEIVNDGNNIVIRCNQSNAKGRTRIATDLDITVPKGAAIEANGRQGDFQINNVGGDVDIVSESAGVRIQDVDGYVKVDTRGSDIVRCTNVKGTVDLKGRGTDVELEKIGGQVSILGSYSGTVSMRDLAKPLRLEGMQTDLTVQKLPGQIRMERGTFSGENLEGPVQMTTRATDVEINGFTDSLQLEVDKGDIDLRPSRVPLAKMNVRTRSGNIEIAVPESAKFELKAATDHGDIENEFGEPLKQVSYGNGAKLEGMVGTGPNLSLVTERGTVTVRKASANSTNDKLPGKMKPGSDDSDDQPLPAPASPAAPKSPKAPKLPVGKAVEL